MTLFFIDVIGSVFWWVFVRFSGLVMIVWVFSFIIGLFVIITVCVNMIIGVISYRLIIFHIGYKCGRIFSFVMIRSQ